MIARNPEIIGEQQQQQHVCVLKGDFKVCEFNRAVCLCKVHYNNPLIRSGHICYMPIVQHYQLNVINHKAFAHITSTGRIQLDSMLNLHVRPVSNPTIYASECACKAHMWRV